LKTFQLCFATFVVQPLPRATFFRLH